MRDIITRSTALPHVKRDKSGVYYIHWTEGGRSKRESTGSKTQQGAREALLRWLLQGSNPAISDRPVQAAPPPTPGGPVCADCWQTYRAMHLKSRPESLASGDASWVNLKKLFGGLTPRQITQEHVDDYEAQRLCGQIGRKAVSSTTRRELGALLAAIRFCTVGHARSVHPDDVPRIKLPLQGAPRDRWLKEEEVERFFAAMRAQREGHRISRHERFAAIALATGARHSAIVQLTWDRVDFDARSIDFRDPKLRETRKKRAVVPISDELQALLVQAFAERTGNFVLDHPGEVKSSITRAAARAGLTGITPNVFRHTAASHLARGGTPLWIVAKLLGNSVRMVDRVYAKWAPDDLRVAANKIKLGGNSAE